MSLVAFDAGHGENTYNETGSKGVPGLEEHHFNAAVVAYAKELAEYNGFDVLLTQPLYKNDVPLIDRTNLANAKKVDLLLSFHADANKPDARGHWGFYWHTSDDGKRFADIWSKYLSAETGTKHRGNQASKPNYWTNFHMVRETKMVAVLMEHAFMTNKEDLKLLQSDIFRKQCAVAVVKALCEYYGRKFENPEEKKVKAMSIELTPGLQKAKDKLVEYGIMAADYELKSSDQVMMLSMVAQLVRKIEDGELKSK